ncbi:hypothetical protein MPSEU_000598600 [Mayamaea pseudoterrestris]|nr:hypothetical protein MPSEU_000598600 [Mayamaea pseudoterrestris]
MRAVRYLTVFIQISVCLALPITHWIEHASHRLFPIQEILHLIDPLQLDNLDLSTKSKQRKRSRDALLLDICTDRRDASFHLLRLVYETCRESALNANDVTGTFMELVRARYDAKKQQRLMELESWRQQQQGNAIRRTVQARVIKTRRVPRRTKLSNITDFDHDLDDDYFESLVQDLSQSKFIEEEYSDFVEYEEEYFEDGVDIDQEMEQFRWPRPGLVLWNATNFLVGLSGRRRYNVLQRQQFTFAFPRDDSLLRLVNLNAFEYEEACDHDEPVQLHPMLTQNKRPETRVERTRRQPPPRQRPIESRNHFADANTVISAHSSFRKVERQSAADRAREAHRRRRPRGGSTDVMMQGDGEEQPFIEGVLSAGGSSMAYQFEDSGDAIDRKFNWGTSLDNESKLATVEPDLLNERFAGWGVADNELIHDLTAERSDGRDGLASGEHVACDDVRFLREAVSGWQFDTPETTNAAEVRSDSDRDHARDKDHGMHAKSRENNFPSHSVQINAPTIDNLHELSILNGGTVVTSYTHGAPTKAWPHSTHVGSVACPQDAQLPEDGNSGTKNNTSAKQVLLEMEDIHLLRQAVLNWDKGPKESIINHARNIKTLGEFEIATPEHAHLQQTYDETFADVLQEYGTDEKSRKSAGVPNSWRSPDLPFSTELKLTANDSADERANERGCVQSGYNKLDGKTEHNDEVGLISNLYIHNSGNDENTRRALSGSVSSPGHIGPWLTAGGMDQYTRESGALKDVGLATEASAVLSSNQRVMRDTYAASLKQREIEVAKTRRAVYGRIGVGPDALPTDNVAIPETVLDDIIVHQALAVSASCMGHATATSNQQRVASQSYGSTLIEPDEHNKVFVSRDNLQPRTAGVALDRRALFSDNLNKVIFDESRPNGWRRHSAAENELYGGKRMRTDSSDGMAARQMRRQIVCKEAAASLDHESDMDVILTAVSGCAAVNGKSVKGMDVYVRAKRQQTGEVEAINAPECNSHGELDVIRDATVERASHTVNTESIFVDSRVGREKVERALSGSAAELYDAARKYTKKRIRRDSVPDIVHGALSGSSSAHNHATGFPRQFTWAGRNQNEHEAEDNYDNQHQQKNLRFLHKTPSGFASSNEDASRLQSKLNSARLHDFRVPHQRRRKTSRAVRHHEFQSLQHRMNDNIYCGQSDTSAPKQSISRRRNDDRLRKCHDAGSLMRRSVVRQLPPVSTRTARAIWKDHDSTRNEKTITMASQLSRANSTALARGSHDLATKKKDNVHSQAYPQVDKLQNIGLHNSSPTAANRSPASPFLEDLIQIDVFEERYSDSTESFTEDEEERTTVNASLPKLAGDIRADGDIKNSSNPAVLDQLFFDTAGRSISADRFAKPTERLSEGRDPDVDMWTRRVRPESQDIGRQFTSSMALAADSLGELSGLMSSHSHRTLEPSSRERSLATNEVIPERNNFIIKNETYDTGSGSATANLDDSTVYVRKDDYTRNRSRQKAKDALSLALRSNLQLVDEEWESMDDSEIEVLRDGCDWDAMATLDDLCVSDEKDGISDLYITDVDDDDDDNNLLDREAELLLDSNDLSWRDDDGKPSYRSPRDMKKEFSIGAADKAIRIAASIRNDALNSFALHYQKPTFRTGRTLLPGMPFFR